MITTIKRYPLALAVPVFIFLLWLFLNQKTQSSSLGLNEHPPSFFKVVVQEIDLAHKDRYLPLVGRTEASRTVNLQAETAGTAQKFFVKEGDVVKKGTLCVKINEGDRPAKIASAKAAVTEKETRYKISKKLLEQKYRSSVDVAVDYNAWQKALSDLKQAEVDLSHTEIRAPFFGIVKKITSEEGEMLPLLSREPVLQIVALDPLFIVAHMNESYRSHVTLGQEAELSWEGLPSKMGIISFIDPVADEGTHTFKIKITVQNSDHLIPGGITTHIRLPLGRHPAHEIPAGSLVLSDQGHQGVYGVDADHVVHFHPVNVIDSTQDKLWVTGLPEKVSLVVVGQGFIKEGERITPSSPLEA